VKAYGTFALNQGMLKSGDMSGTLLFLISEYSKCINGQNIIVDDGWSL
jgi:enoyl-[acyl-carrier-protein] reductase (NADH)